MATVASPALADITDFTVLDNPSSAKTPFKGQAEAGYTGHSGNSDDSSLNAALTGTWFNDPWSYSLWANANNASSDGDQTAEKYSVGGRNRYNLTNKDYLFGQLGWENNRYSGYDSRVNFNLGYGRQILDTEHQSLTLETGPGFRYDKYHDGGSSSKLVGYASATYGYKISDTASFSQKLATLVASDNTTSTSVTSLNVAINSHFTLALSYAIENNSQPPNQVDHKTDTTTNVSLVYGF
ncbi:DUF481 domain-containing protein [Carnimonas bestiolae]|uniref:DUF481 domain-containing protein n=1 Tax=Carnimonas bestiolae TaxID=3402172 RepID=UPI003F4ABE93